MLNELETTEFVTQQTKTLTDERDERTRRRDEKKTKKKVAENTNGGTTPTRFKRRESDKTKITRD